MTHNVVDDRENESNSTLSPSKADRERKPIPPGTIISVTAVMMNASDSLRWNLEIIWTKARFINDLNRRRKMK
jgi:hypothetical protein